MLLPFADSDLPSCRRVETPPLLGNRQIADKLNQAANILAALGADPFRVAAYRKAADSASALDEDLGDIARRGGREALAAIPAVGSAIAAAIAEMLSTGRWAFLEHLKATTSPEALFRSIPGIGGTLARGIRDTLHVDSLEDLETAAHDGRLQTVPGFGRRRVAMVQTALSQLLARVRRPAGRVDEPPIDLLLDVDREYRRRAAAGELVKIAPKRFNPTGEAWLPVLHVTRGTWHFTALYSNTARAHKLHRDKDWVVIFFRREGKAEGQCTVVTEIRGNLAGRRVVRGRETQCRALYAASESASGKSTLDS